MYQEKQTCVECGEEYFLSDGWKKLLEQKPDLLPPKRCWNCRQKRKAEKEDRGFGRDRGFRENNFRSRW